MQVNKIIEALDTMDVPTSRKELTPSNMRWLLRNLRVRNGEHPDIDAVVTVLKERLHDSMKENCPNPGCHCMACGKKE